MRRTRLRVAIVDVRLAEEPGEACQTRALNRVIVHLTGATVEAQVRVQRRSAQIDRLLARSALVLEWTSALERLVDIRALPVVLARLRETRRLGDLAVLADERRGCTSALVLTFVSFASTGVPARILLARIDCLLAVETLVTSRALARERVQLRYARAVVVAWLTGAKIDVVKAVHAHETRRTVASIVGSIRPEATTTIATRTVGFRLVGQLSLIVEAWKEV